MQRRTFLRRMLLSLSGLLAAWTTARATASAGTDEPQVHRGYGPCKYRSCSCYKFDGKSNTCKCGHSFYDHRV